MAGDRAIYPPVRGDGVAREGDTARDRGRRRRSSDWMFGFRGERCDGVFVILLCQEYINKRGLNKSGVVSGRS